MCAHSSASSRGHLRLARAGGSAGRRACGCPTGRPTRACRRSASRPAAGYSAARPVRITSCCGVALGRAVARREAARRRRRRARPSAPPPQPAANAGRILRTRRRSLQTNDARSASSYGAELAARRSDRQGRLGREPSRLDRVVDALERRHVDEPDAVAAEQQPRCVEAHSAARRSRPRGSSSPPTRHARRPRGSRGSADASSAPAAGRAPTARRRGSRGRRPCRA